ncbi:Rieske 2Fe-2S domain-containing protein [Ramlibacter sp.]|uniref:Rieske 2Fe-2S domain-containing protein n=1 Tax=Ramlibacter sp. TaxID=1917967 RepID=UPI002FC711E5
MDVRNEQESWQMACHAEDFEGEEFLECRVDGQDILLVRTPEGIVACPALCPHMEERLAHGMVDGNVLTCTKHLWQWDLCTGDPIGLAEERLKVAPVRLEGGKLLVNMERLRHGGTTCC